MKLVENKPEIILKGIVHRKFNMIILVEALLSIETFDGSRAWKLNKIERMKKINEYQNVIDIILWGDSVEYFM